jgi:4-hydroxy-2-oxoheptanedioate aldolase
MNRLRKALENNGGKTLLGAAVYFYDPIFLEICSYLGYQAIWIEMEHAQISFAQAADLCRMAAGRGMLTMIRIPDTRRENVLKGAECGPDILDVPMVEESNMIQELQKYARFAPMGERGYFSVSRAVHYGIGDKVPAEQQKLNQELCLLAQMETGTAVERVEKLATIPDIDLFVGPADLAASLGHPGNQSHPEVRSACKRILAAAKKNNKMVVTACGQADYSFWIENNASLLFLTNDIAALKSAGMESLKTAQRILAQQRAEACK